MPSVILPGQVGMSRAVVRISCSLGSPASHNQHGISRAWHSLVNKVTTRNVATGLWAATTGAVYARGMVTAASSSSPSAAPAPDGPRVCILGGGFGGLYTAVKLESLFWTRGTKPRVTLIDQADRFTFKPLLYELITGAATADEVAPSYAQLLAPYPVTFVQGRVAAVRPEETTADGGSEGGGTVVLDSGEGLPYDWLVLALGAETNTFGIPGVKEYALPFSTYADASRVVSRLDALAAGASYPEVVVVGGGYAGVELAAAVAEKFQGRGRIQLVTSTSDILNKSPEGQREAAKKALQDDGISITTQAAVTEIRLIAAGGEDQETAKRVVYVKDADGQIEKLEADLVVWAAGQAPVPRIVTPQKLALPFPADASGATQTDPTLRVLRNRKVFALGDIAVAEGQQTGKYATQKLMEKYPATAQVAFQQADYVAWNIWASINNRPLLRFSYQHLGDMMSLGATKGAVTMPIPVPPPISAAAQAGPLGEILRLAGVKVNTTFAGASDGVTLEGPLAAVVRRAAYLYRQPTDQQRLRVAASWAGEATKQAADVARKILAGGNTKPPSSSSS